MSTSTNYLKRIHISVFLACFMLGTILSVAQAAEQTRQDGTDTKNYWKSTGSITSGSSPAKEEDIYIDDEQIEGSGGRGEIHDDLEKDAEYSGSGYGPDDEDSTSRKLYNPSSSSNLNKNNNDRSKVQEQDLGGAGSGDDKLDTDDEDYGDEHDSDLEFDKNDLDDPTTDDQDEDGSFLPTATIQPSGEVISVVGNGSTTEHSIRPATHENDKVEHHDGDKDDDAEEEEESEPDYEEAGTRTIIPVGQNPASTNNKDSKEVLRSNTETDSGSLDLDIDESGNPIIPGTSDKTSESDSTKNYNEVFIMNAKGDDRPTSFFAQPGILAAVIGGAVVGLLCAILVVMFIVYRMRKKDEGSYALDEPKRSPAANSYAKNANNREFYA